MNVYLIVTLSVIGKRGKRMFERFVVLADDIDQAEGLALAQCAEPTAASVSARKRIDVPGQTLPHAIRIGVA